MEGKIQAAFLNVDSHGIELNGLGTMRILYAEDNLIKYMDVVQALKSNGYRDVTNARAVEDAVSVFQNVSNEGEPFDAVLTDMNYPIDNGGESTNEAGETLLHRIRELSPQTPVIVISSVHYRIEDADACIWYSPKQSWDRELLASLGKMGSKGGSLKR